MQNAIQNTTPTAQASAVVRTRMYSFVSGSSAESERDTAHDTLNYGTNCPIRRSLGTRQCRRREKRLNWRHVDLAAAPFERRIKFRIVGLVGPAGSVYSYATPSPKLKQTADCSLISRFMKCIEKNCTESLTLWRYCCTSNLPTNAKKPRNLCCAVKCYGLDLRVAAADRAASGIVFVQNSPHEVSKLGPPP